MGVQALLVLAVVSIQVAFELAWPRGSVAHLIGLLGVVATTASAGYSWALLMPTARDQPMTGNGWGTDLTDSKH